MGRRRKPTSALCLPSNPSPLVSPEEWATIARTLELTPQQGRVVQFILQGQRDKQIASAMGLSVWTVRSHLTKIFVRIGVADRAELLLRIFRILREGDFEKHPRNL